MRFKLDWVRSKNMFRKGGLWNVDFAFTIRKVDINTTRYNLTICGWVEDVANSISFGEWMIGHLDLFRVSGVGQGNKELAS